MTQQNTPLVTGLTIDEVQTMLREFVRARSWEKFHTPKNLVLALTGEMGELAEQFQWLSDLEALEARNDPDWKKNVSYEIADVCSYLLRLADVLNIDLNEAIKEKIKVNSEKYPIEKSRGVALKYDKLK